MNPLGLSLIDSKKETTQEALPPIIATLYGSGAIFRVRCEATGEWLDRAYGSLGYRTEEEKKIMRETIKKVEYQFHEVKEQFDILWVSLPVGFWLSDGRLVSPDYTLGERVKAYHGRKEEILSMGRTIRYVKDGSWTFLPSEITSRK